jgi:hypothetical protein
MAVGYLAGGVEGDGIAERLMQALNLSSHAGGGWFGGGLIDRHQRRQVAAAGRARTRRAPAAAG